MRSGNKSRGFTLIEVMVTIIIGTIIVAVAANGIARAFSGNQASTEARNINEMMANIQSLKGPDGFTSVTMPLLASVEGIPANIKNSKTGMDVLNSWNGAITMSGNATAYTLRYAQVPKAACITIATRVAEAGTWKVHSGATAITTAAVAQSSCSSDTANNLAFTYNATAPIGT